MSFAPALKTTMNEEFFCYPHQEYWDRGGSEQKLCRCRESWVGDIMCFVWRVVLLSCVPPGPAVGFWRVTWLVPLRSETSCVTLAGGGNQWCGVPTLALVSVQLRSGDRAEHWRNIDNYKAADSSLEVGAVATGDWCNAVTTDRDVSTTSSGQVCRD